MSAIDRGLLECPYPLVDHYGRNFQEDLDK